MKDEVQTKLMEKAIQYLNSSEAFLAKEVPSYIEELLSFKITEHLIGYLDHAIPWSIALILGIIIVFFTNKKANQLRHKLEKGTTTVFRRDIDLLKVMPSILLFVLFIGTSTAILNTKELVNAYKAYKAPRVYLIDYFKK